MAQGDDVLEDLFKAAAVLKARDPVRFVRVLELIKAYVSVYEDDESGPAFAARLAAASPRRHKASA